MKFAIGTLLLIVCVGSCFGASNETVRKPNETEIFEFILTDNDWTDVLYVCDFFKTFNFSCNITQEGAEYLKNTSIKSASKITGPKQPKFVIPNVSGIWAEEDGLLKKNHVVLDYLNIVAKCFFRSKYYECFGVPRCDGHGAMSPCHGAEPWRGKYQGTPVTGFIANITDMAMESSGSIQEPASSVNQTESSIEPLIGAQPDSDGLLSSLNKTGRTVVTLTNSSGTFTSTDSEATEGSIEVPANGSLSIIRVLPTTDKNGTNSRGVQVSSFASYSSGSSSPSGSANSNIFPFRGFGGLDLSNLFQGNLQRRRPVPVASNWNAQSGTGTETGTGPSDVTDFGSTNQIAPSATASNNCSDTMDFSQSLNCLIRNFQRNMFKSIFSTLQFPNFQPLRLNAPALPVSFDPMQQSQSMGAGQSQSQTSQGRSFFPRFGGFKVLIVPDNTPHLGERSDNDDDMMSWLLRKK